MLFYVLLAIIVASILLAVGGLCARSLRRRLARLERPDAVRPDWYVERKMRLFERDVMQDIGRWN